MRIEEIKELMNEVKRLNLSAFKYTNNGIEVNIENASNVAEAASELATRYSNFESADVIEQQEVKLEEVAGGETINSPIVGVFYDSSSPDSPTYVSVGDVVKKGSVLCIVEAMKVMNEIIAEYDMKILSVDVSDGEMVEFNQNMFTVEKV